MVLVAVEFKDLPPMEQVFDTLDLDKSRPQTIVMDQNDDKRSLSFVNYSDQIEAIKQLAEDFTKKGLIPNLRQLQFYTLILKMKAINDFKL